MKFSQKLAFPIIISAFATTSCASVSLPKPKVPTFGLGKKAQEKKTQQAAAEAWAQSTKKSDQTPAHLAYTNNNGTMSSEVLGQVSRTDPLNRLKFWSDAYNKNPSDLRTSVSFVRALREIKSHQRAQEIAAHSLVLHPNSLELKIERGKALSSLGNTAEAVRVFRETLAQNSNSAEALAAFALALERSGNSPEAQSAFERAINIEPNRVQTLSNYGMSLARSGNLNKAISLLQRAYALAPSDSKVQSNYALLLGMAGQYDLMRQVNLGTPQELAQQNESILRGMKAGYAYGKPQTIQNIAQNPYGGAPIPQARQAPAASFGQTAAQAALDGVRRSTISQPIPLANVGYSSGLSVKYPYAASVAQGGQGAQRTQGPYYPIQKIQPVQNMVQPYSGGGIYAPTMTSNSSNYGTVAPNFSQTYQATQSQGYQPNLPYSGGIPQAGQAPSRSVREWGELAATDTQGVSPQTEAYQMADLGGSGPALSGGYPYSARAYMQNTQAKPEEIVISDPPPLTGYSY